MSNFFTSSIGKKLVMSLFGLFLIVFLVVHLGINLCLLRNDGGVWFNAAAHFMGTNYIVKVFEVVLMGGFLVHMVWGVLLWFQNLGARGNNRYAVTNHKQTSFFSKYMIHTGAIIFAFLLLHFFNFYFKKLGLVPVNNVLEGAEPDFYKDSIELFTQPLYSWIYIVFFVFLAFHLNHAFQSAFQTMGLNHPTYTPIIKACGLIYSIVIPVGFAIIPIYFMFFY
jgi:succinate dehydrogenase / fumarate reductase cytochrome b subunit